jgi:hypothetical protein
MRREDLESTEGMRNAGRDTSPCCRELAGADEGRLDVVDTGDWSVHNRPLSTALKGGDTSCGCTCGVSLFGQSQLRLVPVYLCSPSIGEPASTVYNVPELQYLAFGDRMVQNVRVTCRTRPFFLSIFSDQSRMTRCPNGQRIPYGGPSSAFTISQCQGPRNDTLR